MAAFVINSENTAIVRKVLEYSKQHSGLPYMPKDALYLVAKHQARLRTIEQQQQPLEANDTNLYILLREPYLPCMKPISQLEKILLADMKTETRHSGRYLLVRRIADWVFARTNVSTVVVDESGAMDFMKFTMGSQGLDEANLLPQDLAIVIKEPMYVVNDEMDERNGLLIVEHPSDLVQVDLQDDLVPAKWKQTDTTGFTSTTAHDWKQMGNEQLRRKEYTRSLHSYTTALSVVDPDEHGLRCDIFRNRAQTNIQLLRFDAAQQDALASVLCGTDSRTKVLDGKAYFRAGYAAYQLRQFSDARSHLQRLLDLCPEDQDGMKLMSSVQSRLNEQVHGDYDFAKLARKISNAKPYIEAADYLKNTEVRQSGEGRGRGLFATKDIQQGDLVLCEKAFATVFSYQEQSRFVNKYDVRTDKFSRSNIGLWREVVAKLDRNPSLIEHITSLHGGHTGLGTSKLEVDGRTVVDTFQIHDIVSRNSFGLPNASVIQPDAEFGVIKATARGPDATAGLWCRISYMNHSCVPNVNRVFLGDSVLVRAIRDIAADEEITLSYIGWHRTTFEAGIPPAYGALTAHARCAPLKGTTQQQRETNESGLLKMRPLPLHQRALRVVQCPMLRSMLS